MVQRLEFMGMRGIENALLRFTNVRVPKENLLWGEGSGLKLALITLNTGRLTLPATCAAGRKWCLQVARAASRASACSGARPVGQHEAVAQMLADIAARHLRDGGGGGSRLRCSATPGKSDIRLEAAIAKLWNTDVAWELCDEALQVAAGAATRPRARWRRAARRRCRSSGCCATCASTASSRARTRSCGCSSRARRSTRTCSVAGDVVMPGVPIGKRLRRLACARCASTRSGTRAAGWAGARWPQYAAFGPLATHLALRRAHRAPPGAAAVPPHGASTGPALERQQAQLFRCVDIGAELFAMAAMCVRARARRRRRPTAPTAIELADLFCRHARRKVEQPLHARSTRTPTRRPTAWRAACSTSRYAWLEQGIFAAPDQPVAEEPFRRNGRGS